jgi:general secretion pathway protein D
MAVAASPKMLEQATRWINRLDRSDGSGTALRTFRLKYGDAKEVVAILNDIFAAQRGATADTPADQLAPNGRPGQSRLESVSTGSSFGATGGAAGAMGSQMPAAGGALGAGGMQNQGGKGGLIATAFDQFGGQKNPDNQSAGAQTAATPKGMVRGVLPDVRVSADVANNSVVVYSNAEDYRVIERAVRQIDLPRLQVAIEATVAEVSLTDQLQFGVQYYLTSQNLIGQRDKGSVGIFNAPQGQTSAIAAASGAASIAASSLLSRVVPGFNVLLGREAQPNVIINALSTLTSVKVLSSPSLVVQDNRPALLAVGDQIPVTTGTATILSTGAPVVNTIQMQNTGVILKVLPHVHPNGTIQLEIDQEISNVVNPDQQTLTPTISERRIHTTVSVPSQQTVLLGGLINDRSQTTRSGIPILQRLDFIGDLFGNTSRGSDRTEIIVFMRPRLIRNNHDAHAVAEEFREKLDFVRYGMPVVDITRPTRIAK